MDEEWGLLIRLLRVSCPSQSQSNQETSQTSACWWHYIVCSVTLYKDVSRYHRCYRLHGPVLVSVPSGAFALDPESSLWRQHGPQARLGDLLWQEGGGRHTARTAASPCCSVVESDSRRRVMCNYLCVGSLFRLLLVCCSLLWSFISYCSVWIRWEVNANCERNWSFWRGMFDGELTDGGGEGLPTAWP